MTDTTETIEQEAQSPEDQAEAYKEAAVELGKGIALGLIPVLGQVIDAYDTIESSITLHQSKAGEDKENAQFDFLLALIGWIPGPGDGVKKALRIVNRDPQRFAPVLFDLLRYVLQECGVETSPEALLDELFNAGKLKAQIEEIKKGVQDSSAFQSLPDSVKTMVLSTLTRATANMPMLVGVVEKRLKKWKRLQHNSSSRGTTQGRAKAPPPKARDDQVAKNGDARPVQSHARDTANGTLSVQPLEALTNEIVGISGEHIADYICAYDFKWGEDWQGHDDGSVGKWTQGTPSKTKLGKLSKGGSPKAAHVLYKLSDGANGTGIDAVWRADGHNQGKPYAIVEAKASKNEDAPKFLRKPNNTRKPGIASTLGVNVITDPSELLEPMEDADGRSGKPAATGKPGGKPKGRASQKPKPRRETKPRRDGTKVRVQMSHDWIDVNLDKAVADGIASDIRRVGYSRHLFYSPRYHPSGSPTAHMDARQQNLPPSAHADHKAFHYAESRVRSAVNARKASLRKKHGNLPSLKEEK